MYEINTTKHKYGGETESISVILPESMKNDAGAMFIDVIYKTLKQIAASNDVRNYPRHIVFDELIDGRLYCNIMSRINDLTTITLGYGPDNAIPTVTELPEGFIRRKSPALREIRQIDNDYTLRSFGGWIDQWLTPLQQEQEVIS